jgi:hypothetical protein
MAAILEGKKPSDATGFSSRGRNDTVTSSGDHGSKYRVEVIGPGRQDWFLEPQSCFRSAHLICGTAHFAFFHRIESVSALDYAGGVSPTVLRVKGFRFYFFSRREEPRAHVHVQQAEGERPIKRRGCRTWGS